MDYRILWRCKKDTSARNITSLRYIKATLHHCTVLFRFTSNIENIITISSLNPNGGIEEFTKFAQVRIVHRKLIVRIVVEDDLADRRWI